jgi:nicotinamide-nucleotide amidase
MKAAIVTIGDEILIGQIVDTNSSYIAKALDKIGVEVAEMRSISDDKKAILETLTALTSCVDLVIITGGLGPTKDDITKKTLCEFFDDHFILDEKVVNHIEALFAKINYTVAQVNRDQALVPSKATVLHNEYGTAPGIWMTKAGTVFVSLPGVPYEMKGILDQYLIPKIVATFQRPFIIHKTIMTYGEGESKIAARIASWEDALPAFIKLAYLPSPGRVRLRLSARGVDEGFLQQSLMQVTSELSDIIGDIIVGFDEGESIEVMLVRLLAQKKLTLALAESCTGGKIAQQITTIPGVSSFFKGGVVAYETATKISVLGVSEKIIQDDGVVSVNVAKAMALGAKKLFQSDFAIATTGNAGPSKGDSEASLGVVCIAIATPNNVIVEEFNFGQPRTKVIDRAVNKAFEMMQKEILKNY